MLFRSEDLAAWLRDIGSGERAAEDDLAAGWLAEAGGAGLESEPEDGTA